MKNEKKNMAIMQLVEKFGRCRVVSNMFDTMEDEKLSVIEWKKAKACKHGINILINQRVQA